MVCALVTTFIWGTAFIAQDTGMDNIGPLTFNSARFNSYSYGIMVYSDEDD